jgi:hypothetical protein
MAYDGANVGTIGNILKEYYMGPVNEQLNNEVLLLSRLEARSEDLVGKRAYVPLHTNRSTGIGARGELAELPAAGSQTYDKAVYDLKYLYGRVQVSGPSMAKSKSDAGAFLNILKGELDGVRNDLRKDLARQVYGDGTGAIAGVAAIAAAAGSPSAQVVTLDNAEAIRKGQLYIGMKVDVLNETGALASGGGALTISAINIATPSITLATTGLEATNASEASFSVARAGAISDGTYPSDANRLSNEVDGLQRIVSTNATNSLGGISVTSSSNTWWDNQRIALDGSTDTDPDVTGTQLGISLDLVQKAMNLVRLQGAMPSIILTSLGIQRDFYSLLQDQVRYTEPTQFRAGFSVLEYAGMPLIADIEAPYGNMYILDESTLKVFSDQDFHFLDGDGNTLRQVPDKDAYEAVMVRYMNLGATKRSNQIVISGVKVDGATDLGY